MSNYWIPLKYLFWEEVSSKLLKGKDKNTTHIKNF